MRTISGAVDSALNASNVPLALFVELNFASGFVRVCNAGYDLPWNGFTWIGVGRLGSIDAVQEGAELQAYGLNLTLSGIPNSMISIALGEQYQGRDCKIWAAPLDSNYQAIADPVLAFWGRMDTMTVELGDTATIILSAESRLADWDRPRIRRYNDEDQQSEYSGDLGFQFTAQMVDKTITWGRT